MRRLTWLLAVGLAVPLPSQNKQNPQPYQPADESIDYEGFKTAYEQAEAPKIAVICGVAMEPGPGATRVGEQALRIFDSSGDADVLRSTLERALLNADVDVVSLQSLDAAQRRQIEVLANQGDAEGAIRQVQAALDAEVAITVWMLPRDGSYRLTVDTTSQSRGAKISTFAFDWKLGTSAAEIKTYGHAISRRLFADFVRNYGRGTPAGSRFDVDLFGVADARQMSEIEAALRAIDGVQRVRATGFSRDRTENVARFRVQFAGSRIALMAALEDVASKALGVECRVADAAGESILVRAAPPPPASAVLVTLSNADTQQDVLDVIAVFGSVLEAEAAFEQHEPATHTGTFRVRGASYEDLVKRIGERGAELPFELGPESPDRTTLSIKLK